MSRRSGVDLSQRFAELMLDNLEELLPRTAIQAYANDGEHTAEYAAPSVTNVVYTVCLGGWEGLYHIQSTGRE